jgi:hypothetical protein
MVFYVLIKVIVSAVVVYRGESSTSQGKCTNSVSFEVKDG